MANGLCGLEIDDKLDVARLLDRQIGRFCAANFGAALQRARDVAQEKDC